MIEAPITKVAVSTNRQKETTMAEINLEGVSKRAAKILTGDALKFIEYYARAKGAKPESLALSAKQWDALEAELKQAKRTLAGCTFRGVELRRADR